MKACENCDTKHDDLYVVPSGVELCAECCSAFISWEMDDGFNQDPEMWAWAETPVMLGRMGIDPSQSHLSLSDAQPADQTVPLRPQYDTKP